MLRRISFGLSAIVLVALFAACASNLKVISEGSNLADYSSYKTYAWRGAEQNKDDWQFGSLGLDGKRPANLKNTGVEKRIFSAVDNELAELGYAKSVKEPDLIIGYEVFVVHGVTVGGDVTVMRNTKKNVTAEMERRNFDRDRNFREFENGTLTINIYDNQTKKQIWLGAAEDKINFKDRSGDKLKRAVKAIMGNFPKREAS